MTCGGTASRPVDVLSTAQRAALEELTRAALSIRYGTVEAVIHDSRIVQITRTEKVRLDHSSPK